MLVLLSQLPWKTQSILQNPLRHKNECVLVAGMYFQGHVLTTYRAIRAVRSGHDLEQCFISYNSVPYNRSKFVKIIFHFIYYFWIICDIEW